jgi:hypothetical protein
MNDAAMQIVLKGLQPIFNSQKMTRQEGADEIYIGSGKAVKVWYDESCSQFKLDVAELKEGEGVDFSTASAWLFDSSHNERDAASVSADFADTLSGIFGIKRAGGIVKRDVSLPSKAAPGNTPGVEAFCNRFLTLFPQYKDMYKEDVAKYGDFLYATFFEKTAGARLREAAEQHDKKQCVKMLDMLDEFYVDGDYTVQSVITYSIIGSAFWDKPELFDEVLAYTDRTEHIKKPGFEMLKYIAKTEKRVK